MPDLLVDPPQNASGLRCIGSCRQLLCLIFWKRADGVGGSRSSDRVRVETTGSKVIVGLPDDLTLHHERHERHGGVLGAVARVHTDEVASTWPVELD